MANIVDYVKEYGDNDFWRLPFNEVDSLVLATLCYADLRLTPFARIDNFNCTVKELYKLTPSKELSRLMWNQARGAELLKAMAKSRRFGDLLMHDYASSYSNDNDEKQFAAFTITLNTPGGYVDYVDYQGTDDTLAGWKEDLNMSFERHVPAQGEALKYLEKVASLSDNKIILGGHSKGGNLAVYAGLKAPSKVQRRIVAIYNHDGPGFLDGTFTDSQIERMRDRIYKTVPEGAFVGLLLDGLSINYKVVESDSRMIYQHDPLSWQVNGCELAKCGHINRISRYRIRSFSRWLNSLSIAERREVSNSLHKILMSSGYDTAPEAKKYIIQNFPKLLKQIRSGNTEVDRAVDKALKLYINSMWTELRILTGQKLRSLFRLDRHR